LTEFNKIHDDDDQIILETNWNSLMAFKHCKHCRLLSSRCL